MAAVWTACTKTQTKAGTETPGRATRSGVLSFITTNFFIFFHRKLQMKWRVFPSSKTTIREPRFHHVSTTKSPQKTTMFHSLFLKTP
jgi:hypothetical protein